MNFSIIHLGSTHLSTSPLLTMQSINGKDIRFSKIISPVFYNTNYLKLYRSKFEKSIATPIYFNKFYSTGSISSRISPQDSSITLFDCYFNEIYAKSNIGSALYISGAEDTNLTQCSFTICYNNLKCGAFYINSTQFDLDSACFYDCKSMVECHVGSVVSQNIIWKNSVAYKCKQERETVDSTLKLSSDSNSFKRMNFSNCDSDTNSGLLSIGSVRLEYGGFFNNTGRSLTGFKNSPKNVYFIYVFAFFNKGNSIASFDINNVARLRLFQLTAQQNEGKVFHIEEVDEIFMADSYIDTAIEPNIPSSFLPFFNVTTETPGLIQEYAVCIPVGTDSESARSPQMKKYITGAYILSAVVVVICISIIIFTEIRERKLKKMK